MRFFEVVLSGAALISAALAVEFTSFPSSVKAGESVTLTYEPKDAATTIILRKGNRDDLDTLQTLTTTSTGGSFTWSVPSNLADATDYAFEIQQAGSSPNYSGQFSLSGGTGAETSSASSAASSASSAASTTVVTSITSAASSASATISSSMGLNSTVSTGSPSATSSKANTASKTSSGPPENTGAASTLGSSPVAIVLGAIAAVAYLA